MSKLKFRELRERLSTTDRISICHKETLKYENFLTAKDVPDFYDDLTVCGVGIIESEFYRTNDFSCAVEGKNEDLVLLPCLEIVVKSPDNSQGNAYDTNISIGSVVKIAGQDNIGIVKNIVSDLVCIDIYYEKDNYLVKPHQKSLNHSNILLANDDDFRVGYLKYLSRREYLHIHSKRDKGRVSTVLYQVKKAWETYPDLRLGQLLMCCCSNDSVMFAIDDEMLMERLHNVFLSNCKGEVKNDIYQAN